MQRILAHLAEHNETPADFPPEPGSIIGQVICSLCGALMDRMRGWILQDGKTQLLRFRCWRCGHDWAHLRPADQVEPSEQETEKQGGAEVSARAFSSIVRRIGDPSF